MTRFSRGGDPGSPEAKADIGVSHTQAEFSEVLRVWYGS